MNRIAASIDRYRAALAKGQRIDGAPLPASFDAAAFERTLDNSPLEHAAYQNAQARAFTGGILSADEAQTVYRALGEAPGSSGWAAGADLATKVVVTNLMAELITRSFKR